MNIFNNSYSTIKYLILFLLCFIYLFTFLSFLFVLLTDHFYILLFFILLSNNGGWRIPTHHSKKERKEKKKSDKNLPSWYFLTAHLCMWCLMWSKYQTNGITSLVILWQRLVADRSPTFSIGFAIMWSCLLTCVRRSNVKEPGGQRSLIWLWKSRRTCVIDRTSMGGEEVDRLMNSKPWN